MNETIRIYYNEQCIYFAQEATNFMAQEQLGNAWIVRNSNDLVDVFNFFVASSFKNLIFEGDPQKMFTIFQSHFTQIQAGGGIVWSDTNELLMIHRLGKWDLPKGKLDPGEDLAQCALREVEEETGLQNTELVKIAKPTYHIFKLNENWILKYTAWYQMKAPKQDLIPQAEEDITKAVWVPQNEVAEKLENSYPNIIYLLEHLL